MTHLDIIFSLGIKAPELSLPAFLYSLLTGFLEAMIILRINKTDQTVIWVQVSANPISKLGRVIIRPLQLISRKKRSSTRWKHVRDYDWLLNPFIGYAQIISVASTIIHFYSEDMLRSFESCGRGYGDTIVEASIKWTEREWTMQALNYQRFH